MEVSEAEEMWIDINKVFSGAEKPGEVEIDFWPKELKQQVEVDDFEPWPVETEQQPPLTPP